MHRVAIPHPNRRAGTDAGPVIAGVVTALVGYTSSFAVVLSGLRAVGATDAQAISGLITLSVLFGLGMLLLTWRYRIPVTLAWSTPGAALLVSTGAVAGGWSAAVGAFVVVGVLIILTGALPILGDLVARIPTSLAQAMLAGILFPLCLAPFQALGASPLRVLPVIVVWLLATRFLTRWAVPLALVAALVVITIDLVRADVALSWSSMVPALAPTMPSLSVPALLGIALPLYVVTMASQNIPGVAVLKSFGYRTPWRASMLVTGVGTTLAAPLGGHAMNLAALSAALAAGPEAGPDRDRRWIAGFTAGWSYLVLAALSGVLVTLAAAAPPGLIEAVAGLALMATMASAIAAALSEPDGRTSAVVTLLVAASGVSIAGIGGAFWALVLGLVIRWVLKRRTA